MRRLLERLGYTVKDDKVTDHSSAQRWEWSSQPSAALVVQSSAQRIDRAYTDQTIRLNAHCRECSDVLPVGAKFCISCAAPVGGSE